MKKIQWNTENGKVSRKVWAKAHHGYHAINDSRKLTNSAVNGNEASLKLLEQSLDNAKANESTPIEDIAKIEADIKSAKNKIDELKKALHTTIEEQNKAIKPATDLITDALYDAYVEWCLEANTDGEGADLKYAEAIAEWFKANGFADAEAEYCKRFTAFVARANNAQSFKNGLLTRAERKSQFATKFTKGLVDALQSLGVINGYKYKYVAPQRRNK